MRHVCLCACHVSPDGPRAFPFRGVDVANVLEAAVACRRCQDNHVAALSNSALANESPVPQRGTGVTVITPEGKTQSWEEYQRDMERRPQPWKRNDEGEGSEA